MEIYSKKYDNFSKHLLFSKVIKQAQEVGPLLFFRFSSPMTLLSDVNFWYLFMFFNQAPGLNKPKIAKKRPKRLIANRSELVVDFARHQYSRIILRLFTFLLKFKDRDDFSVTKFSYGGETQLNIKNCTVNEHTKELGSRTNFFVDDIFLSLKLALNPRHVQCETAYADFIIDLLHRLFYVLFYTKY